MALKRLYNSEGECVCVGRGGGGTYILTFSLSAQFARAMLKLPEERRRWGQSSPLPYGLLFLLSPIFHCHKSKMAATTILQTRTRFRPPKIRLHYRLILTQFHTGGSNRKSNPLYLFIYHFWRKRHPFRILVIEKWHPFHILLCNAA